MSALLGLAALVAFPIVSSLTVLPKPQKQQDDGQIYSIDQAFRFNVVGNDGNALLDDGLARYYSIIFGQRQDGRLGFGAPARDQSTSGSIITGCDVSVADPKTSIKTLETDESYTLTVAAPRIKLTAPTVFGALYGLETLSQLVESALLVNGTAITDKPRYAFRATMLDTSRHFLPLTVLKQHVDAMAYAKMNVLHWHIVDSVSFPFQSKTFPSMSQHGAYSPDHIYTHDNVKDLVAYAMARGVRVIPEFDTPGHVNRGWQELDVLTQCYDSKTGKPGATGPLDPTNNKTYDVLTKLYAEIQAVFAPEKFVHVGGDEVPSDCWAHNPQIQAWLKEHPEVKNFADLETLFEQRLLTMLKDQGSSYIVWQEIFDNGAKILPDTVVDVWKGGWQAEMAKVTAAGFHTVLSAPFYLNVISYGMDWPKYYSVEPSNFTGGDKAEAAGLVGGVEACFWSEYIDSTNLIARAWPRATAIAERGWSSKDVRDIADAQSRIHELRCKLLDRGIGAEPIGVCANEGCNSPLLPTRLPGYGGFCPTEWVPSYSPPFYTGATQRVEAAHNPAFV